MNHTLGGCDAVATQQYLQAHCKPWTHPNLTPKKAYPVDDVSEYVDASLGQPPSVVQSYVRMGAFCVAAPVWNIFMNTADYPMLLDLNPLNPVFDGVFMSNQSRHTH